MTSAGDRHMATLRDTDGNPVSRDGYALDLEEQLDAPGRQGNLSIKAADVYVAAELLDELAAVYEDEPLGRLARRLAVKLYDHLGY